MDALIVGGGAIGQVYGQSLARGGMQVSYLVRPGQESVAQAGFTLHRLRRFRAPATEHLVPAQVFTSAAAVRGSSWDMVWLCVASTSLASSWLQELRDSVGSATVVSLSQDLRDLPRLGAVWPAEQIIVFTAPELAYRAPLAGEPLEGIAYWRPPGTNTTLSGTPMRVTPVISTLRRGGAGARNVGRISQGVLQTAQNIPYIAALELAGWSLSALRAGTALAAAAAHEAASVVAAERGLPAPAGAAETDRKMRRALRLLPLLAPFDVARYLEKHFTKVGAQTRQLLEGWADAGDAQGLPVTHLRQLRRALPPLASPDRI